MTKLLFRSLIIVFFLSTQNLNAQKLDKEIDAFPPDFGKGKTFLFVETIPGYFQVNKALDKTFEKYYTGSYELVDIREMNDAKKIKEDVNYYLFVTIYDKQAGFFRESDMERIKPNTNYSYGIKDLKTDKLYRLSFEGGAYKKLMETYVKKLEEIRLKNESSN